MTTWYEKCMPRIRDIEPHLFSLANAIKGTDGVKKAYIWGSYVENKNNPNFRIKDLDILVKTNFNSGDLIAINKDIIKKNCTNKYLINEGYDPLTVKFSKDFINISKFNIDHWAISSDKKLLHWGPMIVNREESEEIKSEAENFAIKETGHTIKKISKASEETRNNWYQLYNHYINNYLIDMPSGWYASSESNIREITKNALKL